MLWRYFGRAHHNSLAGNLPTWAGIVFVVLPALALQVLAAWFSFVHESIFALSGLAGMRLADAWFSHQLPLQKGSGVSPGQSTALIYFMDAAVLIFAFRAELWAGELVTLSGFLAGAGFFAGVYGLLNATKD